MVFDQMYNLELVAEKSDGLYENVSANSNNIQNKQEEISLNSKVV